MSDTVLAAIRREVERLTAEVFGAHDDAKRQTLPRMRESALWTAANAGECLARQAGLLLDYADRQRRSLADTEEALRQSQRETRREVELHTATEQKRDEALAEVARLRRKNAALSALVASENCPQCYGTCAGGHVPTLDSALCAECGHHLSEHHKLRCEAEGCSSCNGWLCPRHGLRLCGCRYRGGPVPATDDVPVGQLGEVGRARVNVRSEWVNADGTTSPITSGTVSVPLTASIESGEQ